MGRLFARNAIALLLLSLFVVAGCDDGNSGPVGPNPDNRSYGPPHNEVVFADDDGYLATVEDFESGSNPEFVRGVGSGNVTDLGGFLIRPNSTPDNAYFAVYDENTSMLYVLDSDGENSLFFDGAEVLKDMYTFSAAGSRIVYVQEAEDGTQSLVVEGVTSQQDPLVYATLGGGDSFIGPPTTYSLSGNLRVAIAVNVEGEDAIHVYNSDGLRFSAPGSARSLAYKNTSGSDVRLAYINGVPGGTSGSELVILNESLNLVKIIDFSGYGSGALAFAWGPNESNNVALFAGSGSGSSGNLIVINTVTEVVTEVTHPGEYRFPFSDQRVWGRPSWTSTGGGLVFSVRVGESDYDVVRADLTGAVFTLHEGLSGTRFVDYMD